MCISMFLKHNNATNLEKKKTIKVWAKERKIMENGSFFMK